MTFTVYVVGYPGSGKTTAVADAVSLVAPDAPTRTLEPGPENPIVYRETIVAPAGRLLQPGRDRDVFGGTDTLPMNANPKAIAWVRTVRRHPTGLPTVILAEGDRLANRAFFSAAPNLIVVHLDVPAEEAEQRANDRAFRNGNVPQNPTWTKGRRTKTDRLAAWTSDLPNGIAGYARLSNESRDVTARFLGRLVRRLLNQGDANE